MKKVIISLACVAVLAALYACVNVDLSTETDAGQPPSGTAGNEVAFQRVKQGELSGDIKDRIRPDEAQQGCDVLQSGGEYYLIVYVGERPTGGYSVEITGITNENGTVRVTVRETSPKPDDIVTQALTYPFDIVKLPVKISGDIRLDFVK
jgi:hypothetical protein